MVGGACVLGKAHHGAMESQISYFLLIQNMSLKLSCKFANLSPFGLTKIDLTDCQRIL